MAAAGRERAELARQVEDLREERRAVRGVLRAVAQSAGLQPVLDEVVEACQRLCSAEYGSLWLLQDELLHVAAHSMSMTERLAHESEPMAADYDQRHPHTIDRTTAAGRTAVERQPVHIPDIDVDPEYSYDGPRFFRSMLGVPIMVEDDLIGVVVVIRREPRPFTDEHIALVETFADQAAIAVNNARLMDAVERQRQELSRFVSPQVAELISSPDGELLLTGHRAYISSLFCDLRGFTAFAATAAPEDLIGVLSQYHRAVGELIPAYGGTLEHFAGDGVMVFFNDPVPLDEHELQSVRFALAAQERLAELTQAWSKRGTELALGIGIEAGYATLGRIGFEGRYDYGALGPVANLSSRLSTQAAGGQTLIGPRIYAAVETAVETAPARKLELKGLASPVDAYEVLRLRSD